MATLIKGLLSHNLDWQFVLVGVVLAVTVELCGVSPLAFAVGAYLPLTTTFPIFVGGLLRWLCDKIRGQKEESEISTGHAVRDRPRRGRHADGRVQRDPQGDPGGRDQPDGSRSDVLTVCQKIGEGLQEHIKEAMSLDWYSLIFYGILGFILVRVALKKPARRKRRSLEPRKRVRPLGPGGGDPARADGASARARRDPRRRVRRGVDVPRAPRRPHDLGVGADRGARDLGDPAARTASARSSSTTSCRRRARRGSRSPAAVVFTRARR